jgi:hypothetical protein
VRACGRQQGNGERRGETAGGARLGVAEVRGRRPVGDRGHDSGLSRAGRDG